MFYNGAEEKRGTIKSSSPFPTGVSRIVIGRYFTNEDKEYSTVHIDELIYFNNSLTNEEI